MNNDEPIFNNFDDADVGLIVIILTGALTLFSGHYLEVIDLLSQVNSVIGLIILIQVLFGSFVISIIMLASLNGLFNWVRKQIIEICKECE